MKNFWPYRSDPRGFSIEGLARKYREKVSKISSDKNSNEIGEEINLNSIEALKKDKFRSHLSVLKSHWANRDFSEYIDAA